MKSTDSNKASLHFVDSLHSFLAFVPRGLHLTACEWLQQELSPAWRVQTFLLAETPDDTISDIQQLSPQLPKKQRSNPLLSECCRYPVGTIPRQPRDLAFGYKKSGTTEEDSVQTITSTGGTSSGTVWLHIQTNAPIELLTKSLRALGPLLALAGYWENGDQLCWDQAASSRDCSDILQQHVDTVASLLNKSGAYNFEPAFRIWADFVKHSWNLTLEQQQELSAKVNGVFHKKNDKTSSSAPPLLFRLSCMRPDSKTHRYTREQFLTNIGMDAIPAEMNHDQWKVNLKNYDIEIVLLMRHHSLAVGIALKPYQKVGAISFSKGNWPPDISLPYYQPDTMISSSSDLVRLRPATGQLLLHLAQLQQGEVLLDPCAGIGTIPLETVYGKHNVIGLGGDIVLASDAIGPIASNLALAARRDGAKESLSAAAVDLLAWDACALPLRAGCIDVIVSDLPFGMSCSSTQQLANLLPLMLSEMARVLRPKTGRVVLLCGSFLPLLQAMKSTNDQCSAVIWEFPCTSVFPVNIGGHPVWCLQVRRGGGAWQSLPNAMARLQKLVRNRETVEFRSKKRKRRLQA